MHWHCRPGLVEATENYGEFRVARHRNGNVTVTVDNGAELSTLSFTRDQFSRLVRELVWCQFEFELTPNAWMDGEENEH